MSSVSLRYLTLLVVFATSCRDASHDVFCSIDLTNAPVNNIPNTIPVTKNGLEVGKFSIVKRQQGKFLIGKIKFSQPLRVAKNARFELCQPSMSSACSIDIDNKSNNIYLTSQDTVSVSFCKFYYPSYSKSDSIKSQILGYLIYRVIRGTRGDTQTTRRMDSLIKKTAQTSGLFYPKKSSTKNSPR